VVNGIAHVDAGVENALKILALTGDGAIPVAAGQSAPLEGMRAFPEFWRVQANTLGSGETRTRLPDSGAEPYKGTAEDLIIEKLKASKIPITIIAMGPLTNVALALKKDPDIAPKIRKIIAMGGAIKVLGNVDQPFVGIDNSAAEWNFYIDPHAAEAVIKSGVSVVLVPLDATKNLPISPAFVQKVRESPRDATSELLLSLLTSIEDGVEGGWFFFWDTLAAVAATRSEIMATYPARIEIVLENGPSLGQTKSVETGGMEVRVSEEVNREALEKDFLEVVLDR
jgi:pyrimidine-specific ribonucleoside hydrolase